MKRIYKTMLAVMCAIAILLAVPTANAAVYTGTCGGKLTWNLDSVSGILTINGSGIMDDYSADNHAPWFDYRDMIKSVTIGNQVRTIGDYAFFYCTELSDISGCEILGEIGDYAFARSGIERFTANSNLRLIGEYAFSYCSELIYVDTSDITVISDGAFEHCDALKNVVFSSNLVAIGDYAFNCCEALEEVILSSKAVTVGDYAFTRSGIKNCDLTGVTTIGKGAFYHCTVLKELIIPSTVTKIGDRAFVSCNLSTISFDGAAPSVTDAASDNRSFEADVVLGYRSSESGWTTPVWNGYATHIDVLVGDVNGNGSVTNADLVRLARYLVDMAIIADDLLEAADVNGNGSVTNADLVRLSRILVSS